MIKQSARKNDGELGFRLPKEMLWTERLFSFLPIKEDAVGQQMVARFGFLLVLWLSGLLAHAVDGVVLTFTSNLNVYLSLFGTFFIIFFGSYFVQRTQRDVVQNFRSMLKLDDRQFTEFFQRLVRISYSIWPCFFIAIVFIPFYLFNEIQGILQAGLQLHVLWNLAITLFATLLTSTAVWMLALIWLTIFLISRQPLNVELSLETVARFRELSMFALTFSLFYFLGVSIGSIPFLASASTLSFLDIVISPYLTFIVIGIVGVLFPFYNIHLTLLGMKRRALSKISEESQHLLTRLDAALAEHPSAKKSDQTIALMARLFSLQVKEKQVAAAQEWPVDVNFLSKLLVLGLIPIMSRLIAMMILS